MLTSTSSTSVSVAGRGMTLLAAAGSALIVFAATAVILRFLIPVLKSHKVGQKIYDIGPRWHKGKEGTPIMGGLSFIAASFADMAAAFAVFAAKGETDSFMPVLLGMAFALLNALIGFFDDYTKLIKKQNQGFKAWQKFLLQVAVAALYVAGLAFTGTVGTGIPLPYTDAVLDLGFFSYVVYVFIGVGFVNAVNLTDGIDGLAGTVTGIVGIFFAAAAVRACDAGVAVFAGCVAGGCAGFLVYNFYPARIFMGDTGSLFLGGAVTGLAFAVGEPLILLPAGVIYLAEVMSDILQVGWFKITRGKRLFKMAPIHHHFEKCGWSEVKIVTVFGAVTLLGCAAAWMGL